MHQWDYHLIITDDLKPEKHRTYICMTYMYITSIEPLHLVMVLHILGCGLHLQGTNTRCQYEWKVRQINPAAVPCKIQSHTSFSVVSDSTLERVNMSWFDRWSSKSKLISGRGPLSHCTVATEHEGFFVMFLFHWTFDMYQRKKGSCCIQIELVVDQLSRCHSAGAYLHKVRLST